MSSITGPDEVVLSGILEIFETSHLLPVRLFPAIDRLDILTMGSGLPDDAARLIVPDRRLRVPDDSNLQPHRQFLRWHREHMFKG